MTQEINTTKKEEDRQDRLEEDNICDWFSLIKNKDGVVTKVVFIQKKLVERYKKLGYRRYYTNETFHWIKIIDKVVNRVDQVEIIDSFEDFIESIDSSTLAEHEISKDFLINN